MAKKAEPERERRAKIVAAEGEYQAAVKLGQAADIITQHPPGTSAPYFSDDGRKLDYHLFRTVYDDVREAIALLSRHSASKWLTDIFLTSHSTFYLSILSACKRGIVPNIRGERLWQKAWL